jgi:hypothetical protein
VDTAGQALIPYVSFSLSSAAIGTVSSFNCLLHSFVFLGEALTELGYRTYHMNEIIAGRLCQDVQDWTELAQNNCSDTEMLTSLIERGGWTAAVDFPVQLCWEQLMNLYPNAKVIHTERSAEKWWESASNSIMIIANMPLIKFVLRVAPFWRAYYNMLNSMWSYIAKKEVSFADQGWPSVYKNDFISAYHANNNRVRSNVSRDRLLIQDHKKGWNLLTEFLEKDIPSTPYPHSNTRAQIMGGYRNISVALGLGIIFFMSIAVYVGKKVVLRVFASDKGNKEQ